MGKKKVLIVNEQLQYGGSDIVAVRLQQNLDPSKFECTYCVRRDEKGPMEDDIAATGVRIIHQPNDKLSYFKSFLFYLNLFKKEHFDIVHSHLLFYSGIVLLAAKIRGIPKRAAHSHFSEPLVLDNSKVKLFVSKVYRFIMRIILNRCGTDLFSCSQKTGEFLYGKRVFRKKGIILNNGIDCERFKFDKNKGNAIREELGISKDATVIGHVGMLYYIKNQDYVIDVFCEYLKKHSNSFLILVGSDEKVGETVERDRLIKKCEDLGIINKVIFTGNRTDVNYIMMAMDCFVFPSVHEGFPLTLIEAQASKLPCIVSDTVTNKTKLNDNVEFLSIKALPSDWVNIIDELIQKDRELVDNSNVIKSFDIKSISRELEKIYLD